MDGDGYYSAAMEIQKRIKFEGRAYNWDGRYYCRVGGGPRLHRAVWKSHNGPIPDGHHIHHINGDRADNSIENLACLSKADHLEIHRAEGVERGRSEKQLAHLEKIRPSAAAWHSTPEGLEWHRQHGRDVMAKRPMVEKTCILCGDKYESMSLKVQYCSNNCKSKARRQSGVDDISVQCEICFKPFTKNKYSKKRTCGTRCGGILAGKTMSGKPKRRQT